MALTSSMHTAPATKNVKLKSSIYEEIIKIGADETPLLTKIGTSKVTNPLTHSWLTDTLKAPQKNAHLEITGITEDTTNTVQKTSNALQIFKTEAMVSTALLQAKQYGGNEMEYQMSKKAKEHKRDIEFALFGLGRDEDIKKGVFKEYVTPNSNVAGEMAGIFYYLAKTENSFANGKRGNVFAFDDNGDWSGTASELTEERLNQLLQNIWYQGVTPKDVFIGADLKAAINKIATRILGNEKKVSNYITSIDTDFGTINFHLHRLLSAEYGLGDCLIAGDFQFMKHGLYISTKFEEIPTDKTAKAKRIYTQGTLEVRNADAFAIGVGLSGTNVSAKQVSVSKPQAPTQALTLSVEKTDIEVKQGSNISVAVQTNADTLTAVSASEANASVEVQGKNVVITGLKAGTKPTINITASKGVESKTLALSVKVIA